MKFQFPALCLVALTLSCVGQQPETVVPAFSEGEEIIAGIQAGPPSTRTVVEDLQVLWSEGDLLSVFAKNTGNAQYFLKSGAGESHGVFKKERGYHPSGKDYAGYVAVYPYDRAVSLSADGTVSLVLPDTQTYAEDSFGPGANAMVAWSEDTHLSFFNIGSYLELKLHGNARISAIEMTALGGENLAGPIQVVQKEGVPVMQFAKEAEACPTVTLQCPEPVQLDAEEDTHFWIVVPPGMLSEGFGLRFVCQNGKVVEQSYEKEAEFVRSELFSMAPLEVLVEKSYLDYVIEDYKTLAAAYPSAEDHFVEARFTLTDIIADTNPEDLKAESVTTFCYSWIEGQSEISVFERNFSTGETRMYQYYADSPWVGDKTIPESELNSLLFSLEDALLNAKNDEEAAEGDGLETRYVTLRKPIWPVWENPQYVVGGSASRNSHVFVDALTGKVLTLAGGSGGGGSSLEYLIEDQNIIRDMYWMDQILGFPLEIRDDFREVHYVLNKPMNAGQLFELYIKDAIYIYYVPARDDVSDTYLIQGKRDMTQGFAGKIETTAEVVTDAWTGGERLIPNDLDAIISLEDAIYAVKLGNVKDPDTADITLCKPADSPAPLYIFRGVDTPTVVVDAFTGEIITD